MSKLIKIGNKLVRFGTKLGAIPTLPPIAPMTLRFQFGDKTYNPITAGVGSSGTWTQVSHPSYNIWDWTNENTSWATAFGSGSATNPGAFADYDNNKVKVIDAGDTSSVTDFSRLFQNCYGITEVCPIDTSNATTVFCMFSSLYNCPRFPDMDFSKATNVQAVYQLSPMITAPNINLPNNVKYLFANCSSLQTTPLLDTSKVTSMAYMFRGCMHLISIPLFDTSKVTSMEATFMHCHELTTVPLLDLTNVTTIEGIFMYCESLRTVPDFVITKSCNMERIFDTLVEGTQTWYDSKLTDIPNWDWSKATSLSRAFRGCKKLKTIPTMNISSTITKVDRMFEECENIESGALALYNVLSQISSITNHADTFKNCGINTVTGRAELEQIPESWGGLLQE